VKLAVNYSPQAAELVASGAIQIDLWKCPDWPDVMAAAKATGLPPYVHFDLNAGDPEMPMAPWDLIGHFVDDTNTPFINVHLDIKPSLVDAKRPKKSTQRRLIENVKFACDVFSDDEIIAENVAYLDPDRGCHPACTEASVITEVIRETGCGLLLDTAHALLTCRHLGWDVREYISSLPLDQLKEVHVTGTAPEKAKHMDSLQMRDEDWELFAWLISLIRNDKAAEPWVVAFEYGGIGPLFDWRSDPEVLRTQIPRLRKIVFG